jgi:hypothetical protein
MRKRTFIVPRLGSNRNCIKKPNHEKKEKEMDRVKAAAKSLLWSLTRRAKPVAFADLNHVEPVSRGLGWERGMPIDRYYIQSFLAEHANKIVGDALEVGEIKYLKQFGSLATRRSIIVPTLDAARGGSRADEIIVSDLTCLSPELEGRFDTFVCTHTLNFISDVDGAVRGARSLLKLGGAFLGTVAGITQISRYDAERWGDYWRFAPQGIASLLGRHFGDGVEVVEYGNLTAALALLQGFAVEDLPSANLLAPVDPDYPVVMGFLAHRLT